MASLAPAAEATDCCCAETVGSTLYVGGSADLYCYDIERNVWAKLPHSCRLIFRYAPQATACMLSALIVIGFLKGTALLNVSSKVLQKQAWQVVMILTAEQRYFIQKCLYFMGKDHCQVVSGVCTKKCCTKKWWNLWEEKASTCKPHFGSSLLVVNSRLYAAGGCESINSGSYYPCGNPAPVEVYDEENNKWSVVEQKHIPPNKLGAVEIEGKVYFIINKFPVDSGIRIQPGEVYPVPPDK